ncbi:putative f-box domain protein [Botrytis fragariae]|uniref:Putative f-box domain protein n=1 Tax=Botrytis fragariae TaxID=1964551 RepID=A0A8H6AWR8_9HELO|nr:putative f-box domain protein [Botrytis fragariae]KAF5875213.1 putative f-box domain protein [Botrytis fragariae]
MPPAYDEEEGMGPLEKGRHRYQKKNYQGALTAFAEAVKISTGHLLLTALDHRAATYEKLGLLQPALKDAKEMLELKPELSKGYLRCGKVLQLKGEHQLALKIYERGLRKVKIDTDKDRLTLQSMFNKLQKSLAPSKILDPLSYLPFELAEMIAQQLSIRERMICLSVSKSWKRVLESSHKLWTTFDTSITRRGLSQKSLRAYLRRSNYTVDEAILRYDTIDAAKLQYLIRTCTKLQRLTIRNKNNAVIGETLTSALPLAKSLQNLNLQMCQISFRSALESLRHVQASIVQAELMGVHHTSRDAGCIWPRLENLRDLKVCNGFLGSMISLGNLIESIPNIQTLSLSGFDLQNLSPLDLDGPLKSLEVIELISCDLRTVPLLPATLKTLRLHDNLRLSSQKSGNVLFPFLETLTCQDTGLSDEWIVSILKNAHNLKHLGIGSRLVGDYTVAHQNFPVCENVMVLCASYLQYEEKDFIRMVEKCPNLEKLIICGTKITGVAVKHFVNQGIKFLNVMDCGKISPDAIEYARGKGVEVKFNFTDLTTTPNFRDRMIAF